MQRNEFLDMLFKRAAEYGFTRSEAYMVTGGEFSTQILNGEIIDYSVSDFVGLGFRALINGKMGYSSTQILDEDAIELLLSAAKTNAELIESEDTQFIFEGSGEYAHVDSFSDELEALDAAKKIELAKRLETLALAADDKISHVDYCIITSFSENTEIVNTCGLRVSHRKNAIGGYVMPVAKDGESVNTAVRVFAQKTASDIPLERIAREAAEEAVFGLTAHSVKSGEYGVLLRNDAATDLLVTFAGIFSADAAQKGMSLLSGREGEMVASECVTLIDDPHMIEGLASTPFDGEGVATYKKHVIDNGVLTTLLHNLKTAKKQGVTTTANASRASYSSTVDIAPTNFYIAPSGDSRERLMQMLGSGLMITDLQGLHSGANGISGDFSLSAKGFIIENGAITGAVDQITLAGNFYELLKSIVAVGNDLQFGLPGASSYGSPTLYISKLSVAGE